MTYEEFVEKNSQNKVSAGIDNTVALILIKQLSKRYRAAHLFWSWIWVLSIPAFICVAIFYKWWVGLLLLAIITPMISRSTKESAAQFVLSHAIENKNFFNLLLERDLLIFRENCTMTDQVQSNDLSDQSTWGDFQDGEDAYYRGDYTTALKKSRPLAEQGHARAQYRLGVIYATGQGVQQDHAEAVKWFRQALRKLQLLAEQGDASAQFSLGGMYYSGWGVQQDYAEAAKWYRKAAEQGDEMSQYNLSAMYEKGRGVQQDCVAAQKWFSLAAAQGTKGARKNRDRVAQINSILATGDGSREHPYVVSNTKEEYLVLEHFNKTLKMQAVMDIDGKQMDCMVCEDGTAYYFDISTFLNG